MNIVHRFMENDAGFERIHQRAPQASGAPLHQDLAVSEFVEKVKSNSSGWAENVLAGGFAWQRGYSAFTVSESQVEKVRRCIANQQIRHKRVTFEEELRTLL